MIAQGIKAAQGLLGLIGLGLLLSFAFSLQAGSVPDVEFVPLPSPDRDVAAFSRYAVIGSRNLFQTPEDAPALPMIEEVIEDSSLQYKVLGTAAGPADGSVALLEDGRGRRAVVSVGDQIEGVLVERIERGRIVVLNAGRREQLTMEEQAPQPVSLAMLQRGETSVVEINQVPPAPRPPEPPPAFLAIATPSLMAEVDRREALERPRRPRPQDREFPSEDERSRRGVPVGTPAGAAFSALAGPVAGPSESAYEAVAGGPLLQDLRSAVRLRRGERILAVNSIPVDAPDRLPELLRSLLRQGPNRVRIAVDSRSQREIEVVLP